MISLPPNAGDVFRSALSGFSILDEKRRLLSSIDRLGSDARDLEEHGQWLESQISAHSAKLASVHGDMTRVEESIEVAQRQLTDVQSSLLSVKGERNEYCLGLGIEERRRGGLKAGLHSLHSRVVYHTFLLDSV